MMLFLIIVRPFKEKHKNILEIFNETCIFLSTWFLLTFAILENDDPRNIPIGWGFIAIMIANVAFNVCSGLYQSIKQARNFFRKKCCKKKENLISWN